MKELKERILKEGRVLPGDKLQADYDRMKYMLYGKIPTFEQVIDCITTLENEINLLRAF